MVHIRPNAGLYLNKYKEKWEKFMKRSDDETEKYRIVGG
jgi:hypothetical protein